MDAMSKEIELYTNHNVLAFAKMTVCDMTCSFPNDMDSQVLELIQSIHWLPQFTILDPKSRLDEKLLCIERSLITDAEYQILSDTDKKILHKAIEMLAASPRLVGWERIGLSAERRNSFQQSSQHDVLYPLRFDHVLARYEQALLDKFNSPATIFSIVFRTGEILSLSYISLHPQLDALARNILRFWKSISCEPYIPFTRERQWLDFVSLFNQGRLDSFAHPDQLCQHTLQIARLNLFSNADNSKIAVFAAFSAALSRGYALKVSVNQAVLQVGMNRFHPSTFKPRFNQISSDKIIHDIAESLKGNTKQEYSPMIVNRFPKPVYIGTGVMRLPQISTSVPPIMEVVQQVQYGPRLNFGPDASRGQARVFFDPEKAREATPSQADLTSRISSMGVPVFLTETYEPFLSSLPQRQ